ncbi:MAG: hypothetical protein B7Z66_09575 [Chromatiales bacterium 21-64-14]|nr:MAG: hypothetical protein B7Z66_09575 [Chromatiales bacterium 21-64-14]
MSGPDTRRPSALHYVTSRCLKIHPQHPCASGRSQLKLWNLLRNFFPMPLMCSYVTFRWKTPRPKMRLLPSLRSKVVLLTPLNRRGWDVPRAISPESPGADPVGALRWILTGTLLSATFVGYASEGTTGFSSEVYRKPAPHAGSPRSGESVYEYRCAGCHAKNSFGAPVPGDRRDWGQRAQQGMDVLLDHAIHGYRKEFMPPRGGCLSCTDGELRAAIVYMLKRSGVKISTEQTKVPPNPARPH